MAWHTDPCLLVLRDQVDAAAPNRSKASDGTKGDEAHQGTDSAHNPDPSDGNEVDALDLTHDPANGADMQVLTESLRQSRDDRIYLVIFDRQQFSSYSKDGIPPFTWRPYSGSNPHTKHAHVETNDKSHNETRPWKIGIDMPLTSEEYGEIVKGTLTSDNVLHFRLRGIQDSSDPLLAEKYPDWDITTPGLKQLGESLEDVKDAIEEIEIPTVAEVDPEQLRAAVREVLFDPEWLAAVADAVNSNFATRLEN